ncbi:hypothetical protein BCR35DRAFT_298426 [Leucosporidium creatinivorum]|uniref:Zn(2)-C6 fungal-type domain-containing protein n=1 Tax=Leucosporidium creatinivorum TaxID=106004 RepID=A0A1Y2G667_9BASI|nr:hypothetical protein BCR35DRAFT_298426 [Leucosporidium creatinivorum]
MPPSTAVHAKPPRPVYKRSRLGCQTCKRRRKKCPEVYNEDGVCERCEMGGFECEPTADDGKPARSSASASQGSTPKESPPSTSPPHPQPQPPPLYQQAPTSLPSASPTLPSPSYAPLAPPAIPPSSTFSSYPPATAYTDPSTLALTQNLGPDPPSSFSPFADLAYSAALLDFFNNLPPIMPAPGYYSPSTDISNNLLGFGGAGAGGVGGWPLLGGGDLRSFIIKELAEGEDLSSVDGGAELNYTASVYCDFEEEWLRVFEPSQRQLVKQITFGSVTSTPTSRAACLAVVAGLRARLLPPNDSRIDAFIQRSDSYYNQAMQTLMSAPFEVQAGTLFDLMVYQTNQYGAAAGYAVQELVDALVTAHPQLGPHPIPFIAGAPGQVNFLLYGFFALDALRALAFGRRTFFDVPSSGSLPPFTFVGDVTITMDRDILRGVTPHFFFFAARICNLAMDEKEGLLGSVQSRAAAEKLEKEIIEWQPKLPMSKERSPSEELERFGTQEMWRQALLINLRQLLYHVGPLHPSIRASLKSIITLGCSPSAPSTAFPVEPPTLVPSNFATAERAVPWFIAATCAVCEHDRAVIRQALAHKSPFFGTKHLPLGEIIWQATDAAGYPQDWRSVLKKEGISLMFL